METPTTPVLNADSVPRAPTPFGRAIDLTLQTATSWVGLATAYAGAVVAAIIAFQKLSQHLGDWSIWIRVLLVSTLPLAVLVLHTIPTLVDQRRKKRLGEINGTLQTGYFRLAPREDETTFSRADGKHEEILKWLASCNQASILYLTGASGSGKSSLLTAWVLPHLERDETHVIRLRGFQHPLKVLEEELKKPGIIWRRPATGKVDLKSLILAASHHIRPKRLLVLLNEIERILRTQTEAFPVKLVSEEMINAVTDYARQFQAYTEAKNRILDRIAKARVFTLEYTNNRGVNAPDTSNFNFIAATGTGRRIDLTANASFTFFNKRTAAASRIRDFQFAGQIDVPFNLGDAGQFEFWFGGRYERLLEDATTAAGITIPNTKGDIAVGQFGLNIPIRGLGLKLPVALTFANRTELIKERQIHGNFGFTFNWDTLLSKLKP